MNRYPYIQLPDRDLPPFPGLSVTVTPPDWVRSRIKLDVLGFLDTGADCTLLSPNHMMELQLELTRSGEIVRGLGGGQLSGLSAYVNLTIDDFIFRAVKVYEGSQELMGEGIVIGRDVLNLLCVEFDGPNQVFTLKGSSLT